MIPLKILLPGNFIVGFKLKFDIMEIALVDLVMFLPLVDLENYYYLLQPALIKTFLMLYLLALHLEVLHNFWPFLAQLLMSLFP